LRDKIIKNSKHVHVYSLYAPHVFIDLYTNGSTCTMSFEYTFGT